MIAHRRLHGEASRYLADLITPSAAATATAEQVSDPPRLALSQCHVPRHHLVTARSLWPLRARETSCRRHFVALTLLTLSNVSFRLRNDLYCVEWGVKLYSLTHFKRQLKTVLLAQAF